eukprot:gnl/MRDRNA2_/MRDRNA2_74260_c1_seq7.p1 gnl/MRDRNA2_/MRDRNA2_74260_c1~~gnl/MRDRNA2_/MRDRNA2_74260_c1_seq7.p1  ORF type:complete len:519 (+),score=93.29 gnl/MRDRNA2_/MRDRNA2_74260_c1_seq7:87-1643(+)
MVDEAVKKKFFFYVMCLSSTWGCITMFIAISAMAGLAAAAAEVKNVLRNWSLKPIVEISLEDGFCPAGFEEMEDSWSEMTAGYEGTMYDKVWAGYNGTMAGCNCWGKNGEHVKDPYKLSTPACDGNQTKAGCTTIPAMPATDPIAHWRGKRICVLRGDTKALDRKPADEENSCEEGSICGAGSKRPYCYKGKCPLTDAKVAVKKPDESWEQIGLFGDNQYGLFGKRDGSRPLIELATVPCFFSPHVLYQGMNDNLWKFCRNLNDPRWLRKVDEYEHRGLMVDNLGEPKVFEIESEVPDHAPDRKECSWDAKECKSIFGSSTDRWELAIKPEIMWKRECIIEDPKREEVKENEDPMEAVVAAQTWLVIFTMGNCLITTAMTYMLWRNYMHGKDWSCWSGAGDEEYKKMRRDKKRFSLCCKICMLPISIACVAYAGKIKGFFSDVASKKCSDDVTNEQIDALDAGIQDVYSKNVTALCMTLGLFVFEFAMAAKAKRDEMKEASAIAPAAECSTSEKKVQP